MCVCVVCVCVCGVWCVVCGVWCVVCGVCVCVCVCVSISESTVDAAIRKIKEGKDLPRSSWQEKCQIP